MPTGDSTVVVESGPVVYDDGAADEEDEEDEEPCVSAMDLLGHNGQSDHTGSLLGPLLLFMWSHHITVVMTTQSTFSYLI